MTEYILIALMAVGAGVIILGVRYEFIGIGMLLTAELIPMSMHAISQEPLDYLVE